MPDLLQTFSPSAAGTLGAPSTMSVAAAPALQAGMSGQPRRQFQPDASENKTFSVHTSNLARSTSTTTILGQSASSEYASSKFVQDAEQADFSNAQRPGCPQAITSPPEMITSDLLRDVRLETDDSWSKGTVRTDTTRVITTAKVEGTMQSTVAREEPKQPRLLRTLSVLPENVPSMVLSPSPSTSHSTRRFSEPPKSSGVIENSLFGIQHSHREEMDHILIILKTQQDEHQNREHAYIEQLELLQTKREELARDLSASTTENSMLKFRLSLFEASNTGPAPSHDALDPSVTTTITTAITTITTVTTQIEQWKDAVLGGSLTLEKADLDRLSISLSNASTQMTKLRRDYDELSRELISVRRRLEMTLSLCDEKDRTITSITDEDGAKGQQLVAFRRDSDSLRRDISTLSLENEELRQQLRILSAQLDSAHTGLKSSEPSIEDQENSNSIFKDRVTHLEWSEASKTREITTLRQQYETLKRGSSEEIVELQKRCAELTKERDSARNALHESKGLVDSKDDTITNSTSEVARLGNANDSITQKLDTERQEKQRLQNELVNLQERYDVEIVSLRDELGTKAMLLLKHEQSIVSFTTERDQARREIAVKEKLFVSARQKAEQLQQEISVVRKEKADLQGLFAAQLMELNELCDERDRLNIFLQSLDSGVSDGRQADTVICRALEGKEKQIKELRQDIAIAVSRERDLQKSVEELASEVSALSDDLKVKTSLHETAKNTIDALTFQVGRLESSITEKTEQLGTATNRVRELEFEVDTFALKLKELQGRYDARSQEFVSVKNQLSFLTSSVQGKDRDILSLTTERDQLAQQIAELKRESSALSSHLTEFQENHMKQSTEFVSVRCKFDTCNMTVRDQDCDIAALKDQIAEDRSNTPNEELIVDLQHHLTNSHSRANVLELDSLQERLRVDDSAIISSRKAEVEDWKKQHGTAGSELKTTRDILLRCDLGVGCSELERAFTSQITQLQQSNSNKSKELIVAHGKLIAAQADLEKLRNDLAISSIKISECQEKYDRETRELKSQLEWWQSSSTAQEKEPAISCETLEEFKHKLQFFQEQFSVVPTGSSAAEWEVTKRKILSEVQDYTDVIELTTTVDQRVSVDTKGAQALPLQLEERNKENEELRQRLRMLREIYIRAPRIKQIFQSETIAIKTIEMKRRYEEDLKALKVALVDSRSKLQGVVTADTYADETILSVLKKLNAEVLQNTTYMAEHIAKDFQRSATKLTEKESKSLCESIGEALANGLASMEHDVVLYLSIAFQAFFSHYLYQAICLWTINEEYNAFINEIYASLQQAETQQMSGRWRALTRVYVPAARTSNSSPILQQILTGLSYVVVAAGCATSVAAANSKLSPYKDKVVSIITTAGRFSEMIWMTVSADFTIVVPSPRQTFEEATMEEDGEGEGEGRGTMARMPVLCSTQLGMTKRVRRESGSETLTVMKAKVIFESFCKVELAQRA